MYGRTDGSAWTGLAFGDDENGQGSPAGHGANAGLWSYLYTNPNSTYDAEGRLTSWVVPKWGTYPGEDGPFFSAKPVPWSSIESPLIAIAAGAEASADGDELLTQDGTAFLVIRGNADRPDVLAGTADADAMRAGADDVLSAGTGDDVVLVDAASGGAVVDGGAGGTDVLRLMPDPVRVPAPSAPWGLALVLDPLPGGAPRVPHSMGDGTVDLGADASGRLEFPGGGSVRFRGVERIRY
jgi:hypothetical protein